MAEHLLLILNESPDAAAISLALSKADGNVFEVESVRNCSDAIARLSGPRRRGAAAICAVVTELDLPDSHGIETFDRISSAAPRTPILVLCSAHNQDVGRLAVQRGAQDYLLKERLDDYLLPKAIFNTIQRATAGEALFEEQERARVTLNSIGDAVISTDRRGNVSYLNPVAETLIGWSREEASGRPLDEVLRIIDAVTREPAPSPMAAAIRWDRTVSLTPNCALIRRDGAEIGIEDSAAPIHDRRGKVVGAVMVFHDVSAARARTLELAHLAQHDPLTDLPNRLLFVDRLNHAISLARRKGEKLAVLYIDLDRFKNVNDSLGHAIGDRLLCEVAQRLVESVRDSDTVSRRGGDEFVVLLSTIAHAKDAAVSAEKLLLAIAAPCRIDEHVLHVTGSIGVATYPDDGIDAETLLQSADSAMYHGKDKRAGGFQFFKSSMNVRAVERRALEDGLRTGLERKEFVLHYQPMLDLASGAISGVEALVRWRHPLRGLILPGEMIPIADECGLIVPLGRWVLREACRQARAWQLAGVPNVRVAVNVSAVELRADRFVAGVRATLEETGLPPECVELELTETFLLQDPRETASVLRAVKDLGVQLALDDFGTGYSSLSYLSRFPIDTLKIDRSFVRDLTTDPSDASIVSAVIGMGERLKLRVVAEGVETPAQLAFLRQQNCRYGQGYHFSVPTDAAASGRLLMRASAAPAPATLTAVS